MRLSFRDPDGFVFRSGERIFRCVFPHATDDVLAFLSSALAVRLMADGALVRTAILTEPLDPAVRAEWEAHIPDRAILLEHAPVRFASYPYEWAPEMLHSAAALTLRLAREALGAGFGLKDATPYNVMFKGPKPVFIDLLSFERRAPLDPLWRPYAQFVRTFVYPLLAASQFGFRLDETMLANRDGLEPERLLRMCSPLQRMLPPFLSSVTIPALLSRESKNSEPNRFRARSAKDKQEANFLLSRLFSRADGLLRVPSPAGRSAASRYMESGHTYSPSELAVKERVVNEALKDSAVKNVLDIGCNTGHFSVLAARQGARVVAIDRDPEAVGALWRAGAAGNLEILPLVVDIARPPGAVGWANGESPSFLDRARGKFDCVLMLALLHHLLVNERISLEAVFAMTAELTTRLFIVEYVDPADAQFSRIARGRDTLYAYLTRNTFESAARCRFDILEACEVSPTRRVYVLRKA